MRIAFISPGTGSFLCGSCMRDNTLVRALRARGHDAVLLPLYLPTLTDEPDMSEGMPIFFGGINVYLQQHSGLFRHTPRLVDRFLDNRSLLTRVSRRAGMTDPHVLGAMTVSMLEGEQGRQRKELERLIDWLAGQRPAFDVLCLSNGLLLGLAPALRRRLEALVLCCLQGEDIFVDELPETWSRQVWDLLARRARSVDGLVTVSHYYGGVMRRRLGLSTDSLRVVHNGIDLDGFRPAERPPKTPTLGYLARFCEAKGLDRLVDAFITLRRAYGLSDLRLLLVGTCMDADRPFLDQQLGRLREAGVDDAVEVHANVDRETKQDLLRRMSVLSVPTNYGEAFGLYLLEAMASAVPVVQPMQGAFPELVEATGGGMLATPEDPAALPQALAHLLTNPSEARALGLYGRDAVREKFSAERMAEAMEACIERFLGERFHPPLPASDHEGAAEGAGA